MVLMYRSIRHTIRLCLSIMAVLPACHLFCAEPLPVTPEGNSATDDSIFVAAYYFPNYHPSDPRNVVQKGPGWCEWELVKAAKPRFSGHQQPKVPLWGYQDESDPKEMQKKITAAADNGVDAFIYDWYFYNDGPFLERGLENGFMKAANAERLKFGLMWANHDYFDIFPANAEGQPALLYPGEMTKQGFEKMTEYVIKTYFDHPSYWLIDGKPYFSIYDLGALLGSFGSVAATREALDSFRAKAKKAGLPGLHLNAVVWGRPVLPGGTTPPDPAKLVTDLGFDSTTSYVWIHHVNLDWPTMDYVKAREGYLEHWSRMLRDFQQPYFPNVTVGWDSTPRTNQSEPWVQTRYPYTGVLVGNSPAAFRDSLQLVKDRLLAVPTKPKIVTVNCWNEWTEGSYLEPDLLNRFQYLEALRDVFGSSDH